MTIDYYHTLKPTNLWTVANPSENGQTDFSSIAVELRLPTQLASAVQPAFLAASQMQRDGELQIKPLRGWTIPL